MNKLIYLLLCSCFLWTSCNDDEENSIKEDPYAGGREPLTIKLLNEKPSPESAAPGESVTFRTAGLVPYCHPEESRYDFEFYISDEICRIESATDTTVTIIVPEALSSGTTYISLEGQIFYGPYFKVLGSIVLDEAFSSLKHSDPGKLDGVAYQAMPWWKNTALDSRFYLCGDFLQASADNLRWGGVSMIKHETGFVGRKTTDFNTYRGIQLGSRYSYEGNTSNEVYGMEYLKSESSSPRVLLYGSFSKYQSESGTYYYTNHNIALLNNDFSIPTAKQTYYDNRGSKHDFNLLTFTGGADDMILRAFSTSSGKIVAVGNFNNHQLSDYANSTCNTNGNFFEEIILTDAKDLMRMGLTGELDNTWRRDPADAEKSLPGTEGTIKDACMLNDESIVIVGEMNDFDGVPVHNIVKLDANGQINNAFMSNIGGGANGIVNKITYTTFKDETGVQQQRIVVVGNFTEFNGKPAKGLVMMDADGVVDEGFLGKVRNMEGGFPNFAKIVDINASGDKPMPYMVISGTFNKYAGVIRRGFLVLDLKGDAIQRFNVPGEFVGQLYDAQYSLTSDNANGILIVGNIYYFDGKAMNNIAMLKVELEENVSTND
ncbi:MAG: DUF5008 domain-containing protein [Prevotella sp.]|jgi:hypothetical protein|nr:DUF5008 domain-containing protein [Prevotella sp.]